MEITRIPDDISDENLEEKIIQVLSEIQGSISSPDVEACHHVAKCRNSPKKTAVQFINRKNVKKANVINLH